MNRYAVHGYSCRQEYLMSLAEEYMIPLNDVMYAAEVLGPSEDFDGLVTTLQDMELEIL